MDAALPAVADLDPSAILAFAHALVAIESPTSHPAGVNRALDAVAAAFAGLDVAVDRTATGAVFGDMLEVRCHPGRDEPGILVLAHLDTVHPVGTLAGGLPWRVEGDRAYGPGVYDMKGGVAIAVAAAQRILRAGRATRLPVTFLFTPDEEVGSPVSRARIEALARRCRHALVVEPARDGGKIVTSRKGVGRFTLRAEGRPSHAGSYHDKGASAVREMARQILAVEGFTDYARGITTNVGLVRGGTGVNVVPAECVCECDLRVETAAAGAEMTARFLALASSDPQVRLTVEGGMNRPAFARNAAISELFDKAAAIAAEIGFPLVSSGLVGGGSDGTSTVGVGAPTLDGLGPDGAGAHTLDEHIFVSSLAPRSLLLQGLMERLE